MPELRVYLIRELADEFGITLRSLRLYEQKGLLTPDRSGTYSGVLRGYSAADRQRLKRILEGKALGLTLAEIKEMLERPAVRRIGALPLTRVETEVQIARLEGVARDTAVALTRLRAHLDDLSSMPELEDAGGTKRRRWKLTGGPLKR